MVHGQGRASLLVDGRGGYRPGATLDRYQRNAVDHVAQCLGSPGVGGDDDDAVDPSLLQALGGLRDGAAGDRAQPDDAEVVPGGPGRRFDGEERRRRPVERGRQGDDPHGARPARGQRPRERVGPVPQGPHRGEDPVPGLRRDTGMVVQHPGHGHVGDAGEDGHIRHHRRASACGSLGLTRFRDPADHVTPSASRLPASRISVGKRRRPASTTAPGGGSCVGIDSTGIDSTGMITPSPVVAARLASAP